MLTALIGFVSGIGVVLVAAITTSFLTRRRELHRAMELRRFQVFMKLLELNQQYFFWASSEVQGRDVPEEIRRSCRKLAWEIADMVREGDDVDYLEEILEVCLGPGFETASKRHDAMGDLLEKLGNRVSPRYQRRIRDISKRSVLGTGRPSNAPGAIWM